MFDQDRLRAPAALAAIQAATATIDFPMASQPSTGALLRTLATTKPGGKLLELGTGTGIGTAWLLAGMDAGARLITVDIRTEATAIAQKYLAHDPRVTFYTGDAADILPMLSHGDFDLIFADTFVGKYLLFDEALQLLKVGGLYVIDDMLPQPNWPEDHAPKVQRLLDVLNQHPQLSVTGLSWASGIVIAARRAT